jgi:hypothetical protein
VARLSTVIDMLEGAGVLIETTGKRRDRSWACQGLPLARSCRWPDLAGQHSPNSETTTVDEFFLWSVVHDFPV